MCVCLHTVERATVIIRPFLSTENRWSWLTEMGDEEKESWESTHTETLPTSTGKNGEMDKFQEVI